ncbi:MAG: DUF4129 domain-containing protein, partial [Chromatiales bacterium]|nr:DUF4129 domain-containing protein [Chromatiales bacterium]
RDPIDPTLAAYERFCARLARVGVSRAASEGPVDFANRASHLLPHLQKDINFISKLYVRARYADHPAALVSFINAVRKFKPRPFAR